MPLQLSMGHSFPSPTLQIHASLTPAAQHVELNDVSPLPCSPVKARGIKNWWKVKSLVCFQLLLLLSLFDKWYVLYVWNFRHPYFWDWKIWKSIVDWYTFMQPCRWLHEWSMSKHLKHPWAWDSSGKQCARCEKCTSIWPSPLILHWTSGGVPVVGLVPGRDQIVQKCKNYMSSCTCFLSSQDFPSLFPPM